MRSFTPLVFLSILAATANALSSVTVQGNAFFVDGERFYIRGVDYQPGGSSDLFDPLSDPKTCERDIKYFTQLGLNTVRVYSVDNTADHDECMAKLAEAGIYVILDVNNPFASITREESACSYNTLYLNEVFATVKAFAAYNNTLGFFAGNEVINDGPSVAAAPYVKATIRDIKTFIKNNGLRSIPVGYSAAAVDEYNLPSAEYFNCGDDELARVDMYGFNDYSWCGKASMQTSGWDQKVDEFKNYSLPLFFSEYGCNNPSPRPFTDVTALYSTDMSSVFSGGLVYEYSQAANKYGLVEISDGNVTTLDDFDNLKSQLSATKNPSGNGGFSKSLKFSNCPKQTSTWNATTDLPDTPKGALKYINGDADPRGGGFNASTQQACSYAENNVDDSDKYNGSSKVTTKSSPSPSTSSEVTSSTSSSTSKKSNANGLIAADNGIFNYVGLAGLVAGLALL
ncbi:Glucanosyltransferase-domain-containing protein [Scheffersomyces xylosifermentans]|uniref:Glucanosyltransferase-domain-containing protein n=1 Tax=Scheffersomyces xylosifermentans TaxID=1304137 RepID=UPI00315DF36E